MGVMKNAKQERKDRKNVARNGSRRVRRDEGQIADWAGVDPRILVAAIATVGRAGGALRLGYTSDGGAYAVGIYGDGEPYTDYIRPNEDVDAYLSALVESWINI